MILVFLFVSTVLSCLPLICTATDDDTSMHSFPISGTLLEYPFNNASDAQRGLIQVDCSLNHEDIQLGRHPYQIAGKHGNHSFFLIPNRRFEELLEKNSSDALYFSFTSPTPLLFSISIRSFMTLFKCTKDPKDAEQIDAYFIKHGYNSHKSCKDHKFYYNHHLVSNSTVPSHLPPTCEVIRLPVKEQSAEGNETDIFSLLAHEFSVSFNLSSSCQECCKNKGQCQTNNEQFECKFPEYLHSGCNTRILHFDIKPHNILLDKDLCPKISDFGLAKLFPDNRSIISMSCMRGTPGYIAPELFNKNFGQVSHKADVYSYGMMILEMVGGRKNIEVEVDHTSEIYFPHWIYKKVQLNEEKLGLHGIISDEDNEMARKMIIAGLWCIQTNPLRRPTITKVLEMLEGDLASIEIPPKPYLSSP
ncbi:Protein kinase, catalytic domain-containing protein [Cynara cardunculus var. scolymus]|uniref:Protein kinase, catalytic domain-containing protein n=1 Tax=Cynara cardunculus var. scolymus TaxID=59895 RepID=A0A124SD98_CYNCS|nr:Protein kinase, catalytic domain-containing protein [Cynara cardunculus var. scolymus]